MASSARDRRARAEDSAARCARRSSLPPGSRRVWSPAKLKDASSAFTLTSAAGKAELEAIRDALVVGPEGHRVAAFHLEAQFVVALRAIFAARRATTGTTTRSTWAVFAERTFGPTPSPLRPRRAKRGAVDQKLADAGARCSAPARRSRTRTRCGRRASGARTAAARRDDGAASAAQARVSSFEAPACARLDPRYAWRPGPAPGCPAPSGPRSQRVHAGRRLVDLAREGDRALQDRLEARPCPGCAPSGTRARPPGACSRRRASAARARRADDRASPRCGSAGRRADRASPCPAARARSSTTCFFQAFT